MILYRHIRYQRKASFDLKLRSHEKCDNRNVDFISSNIWKWSFGIPGFQLMDYFPYHFHYFLSFSLFLIILILLLYYYLIILSYCDLRGLVCTIVVGADGREKCFMSCINSLSQADIGLSQKVMRNAKTFYHNSTIGARLRDLYYICQTIHGNTKKQKYRNQCFPFQRSTTSSPKRWMQNMFSKPRHFFCPHPKVPFQPLVW